MQELTGTRTFSYDPIERLTGVTQTSPAPATQVESYTYDTEGNRLASHISASYVTDAANHVLADANNSYTWSTDGDLTSRTPKNGGVGYNFSSTFVGVTNQMRLDSIAGSDGSAISLYYDPFQRLVSRHWPAPRGDDALYYDGPDVVLELRYPSAGGSQWVRYVHGPGMDQPLATEVFPAGAAPAPGTGSQYYYHADGEGSIRLLTDANGQIANRYDYDFYGQRLTVIESLPLQPYGWKGREWIPGPNIYYNRARFYDPVLGRFMSQDPLGYEGGDWNLYSFAWNNPRNWNDPEGLSATAEDAGITGATAGAILGDGTVAVEGGTIQSGAQASQVISTTGSAVQKIGAEVACKLFQVAAALDFALSAPSDAIPLPTQCGIITVMAAEHTKGARPSTLPTHEKGGARKKTDKGGEAGDKRRDPPRKKPTNWQGPWPPPKP